MFRRASAADRLGEFPLDATVVEAVMRTIRVDAGNQILKVTSVTWPLAPLGWSKNVSRSGTPSAFVSRDTNGSLTLFMLGGGCGLRGVSS